MLFLLCFGHLPGWRGNPTTGLGTGLREGQGRWVQPGAASQRGLTQGAGEADLQTGNAFVVVQSSRSDTGVKDMSLPLSPGIPAWFFFFFSSSLLCLVQMNPTLSG